MTESHRYSEQEIHAIFERAAKRQEQARRAEAASEAGLTLEELQRIGRAAGIEPEHVASAAANLSVSEPPRAVDSVFGVPSEVRRERVLQRPATDEAWERMVTELRRAFGQSGVAGEVGRVREWSTTSDDKAPVRVTVTPEGEASRVVIEQQLQSQHEGLKTGLATGLVMALFLAGYLVWGDFPAYYPILIPGLVLAMVGALVGGTWFQLTRHARQQDERFAAVLDRIDLIARDATESPTRTAPRLDLDTLHDEARSTNTSERRRTRS